MKQFLMVLVGFFFLHSISQAVEDPKTCRDVEVGDAKKMLQVLTGFTEDIQSSFGLLLRDFPFGDEPLLDDINQVPNWARSRGQIRHTFTAENRKTFLSLFVEEERTTFKHHFGEDVFIDRYIIIDKSPRLLVNEMRSLESLWDKADAKPEDYQKSFSSIQDAYWKTLASTFIFIESMKEFYFYEDATLPVKWTGRETRFKNLIAGLYNQTKDLIECIYEIRIRSAMAKLAPAEGFGDYYWEDVFAEYYHYSTEAFDILSIGPVKDYTPYLYPSMEQDKLPETVKEVIKKAIEKKSPSTQETLPAPKSTTDETDKEKAVLPPVPADEKVDTPKPSGQRKPWRKPKKDDADKVTAEDVEEKEIEADDDADVDDSQQKAVEKEDIVT